MIRRLHPCFSAGWSRFFCARMRGKRGLWKKGLWKKNKENHSLLWKYYGLCLRGVAHLCSVTNTGKYKVT